MRARLLLLVFAASSCVACASRSAAPTAVPEIPMYSTEEWVAMTSVTTVPEIPAGFHLRPMGPPGPSGSMFSRIGRGVGHSR